MTFPRFLHHPCPCWVLKWTRRAMAHPCSCTLLPLLLAQTLVTCSPTSTQHCISLRHWDPCLGIGCQLQFHVWDCAHVCHQPTLVYQLCLYGVSMYVCVCPLIHAHCSPRLKQACLPRNWFIWSRKSKRLSAEYQACTSVLVSTSTSSRMMTNLWILPLRIARWAWMSRSVSLSSHILTCASTNLCSFLWVSELPLAFTMHCELNSTLVWSMAGSARVLPSLH